MGPLFVYVNSDKVDEFLEKYYYHNNDKSDEESTNNNKDNNEA